MNADPYLAYWDIVRNYYSFSQWKAYSFAWPASWYLAHVSVSGHSEYSVTKSGTAYFTQRYGNLEYLDAYYESQFYPNAVTSPDGTFNRGNLFLQIVNSDLNVKVSSSMSDGYPVASLSPFATTGYFGSPSPQFVSAPAPVVTHGTVLRTNGVATPCANLTVLCTAPTSIL